MQLIRFSDYKLMPWKNGLGKTLEIAVSDDKSWRLSAATILQPAFFSDYSGFDRWLTVWQGQGLMLNDYQLEKNAVTRFQGEESIFCKNLGGQVIDFGFIFKRNNIKAEMRIHKLAETTQLHLSMSQVFVFCSKGSFSLNDFIVEAGDTLKLQDLSSIELKTVSENTELIIVEFEQTHLES